MFELKLSFNDLLSTCTSSALRTLGFLVRNCREFTREDALKVLFTSYVRSKLEYCCLVWQPSYAASITALEKVQRKFLKYLTYRIDGIYPAQGCDHHQLLDRFAFKSLHERRELLSVKFLYKLLHNEIDCSEILSKIAFLVPRRNARQPLTFRLPCPNSNMLLSSPLHVMLTTFNRICSLCDINCDSISAVLSLIHC